MSRRGVLSFLPALLFGVFPVVALYAHNIEQLKRDQLWSPLALAAAMAGGVFWVSFWVARRNADRASVMSSALLVCFFAYGHVVQFVKPYVPLRLVPFWALAVFVLFCGVIVAVVCWARRSQAVPGRATVVLNVVGAFLVMSSGIRVVAFERSVRVSEPLWRLPSGGGVLEGDRALPNIVHLVFDRYPSLSTLRDLYGYDNREFLDSLKMLGFFVAESSCCNYGSTDMSLSSTLNLDYVDSLFYAVPVAIRSRVWAEAMQNNRVVGLLKQQGYRYTHMGSWWGPTSFSRHADVNFNPQMMPEFTMMLYRTTLAFFAGAIFDIDPRREQWVRVRKKLDYLETLDLSDGPHYVFAHFLIPHEPYVFERDGRFLSRFDRAGLSTEQAFLNQVVYVNSRLEKLLARLAAGDGEHPTFVVVHSDEGPHPPHNFEHRDSLQALRAKFRILNAYYLPGVDSAVLYSEISPVNTFRVVFNICFGSSWDLLPDESYRVDGRELVRVTDAVRY